MTTSNDTLSIQDIEAAVVHHQQPTDWRHFDVHGVHTLTHNPDVRLHRPEEDNRTFHASWTSKFPDSAAYTVMIHLYYRSSLIEVFTFVEVDGGRHLLPRPHPADATITTLQYAVGRVLNHTDNSVDGYDRALTQAGITVA